MRAAAGLLPLFLLFVTVRGEAQSVEQVKQDRLYPGAGDSSSSDNASPSDSMPTKLGDSTNLGPKASYEKDRRAAENLYAYAPAAKPLPVGSTASRKLAPAESRGSNLGLVLGLIVGIGSLVGAVVVLVVWNYRRHHAKHGPVSAAMLGLSRSARRPPTTPTPHAA